MGKYFRIILKVIGVVVLLCIIGYLGLIGYATCKGPETAQSDTPPQVQYSLTIKNTGYTIYADTILTILVPKDDGQWSSQQLYAYALPNGYWESVHGKWVFKKVSSLILDERVFGSIEVKKR